MSFRDLERADQLIADYNNYRAWKAKSSSERQTLYDTLNVNRFTYEKQDLFVAPFSVVGRDFFVPVRGPATGQAPPAPTLLALLAGYFETVVPGTPGVSLAQPGIYPISKLARLTVKFRQTTATTKDESRITKRKYFRHSTNSASMPFGKKLPGDDYFEAVKLITALPAFGTFNNVKGNSIAFTPEG